MAVAPLDLRGSFDGLGAELGRPLWHEDATALDRLLADFAAGM